MGNVLIIKTAVLFLLFTFSFNCLAQNSKRKSEISIGIFKHVFDQSIGEEKTWHINDHCFIKGPDGKWHMFGITMTDDPEDGDGTKLAHAVTDDLYGHWEKQPYALTAEMDFNETVTWAPHIIKQNDLYYMYYCGGSPDHRRYQMNLAVSKNLYEWSRYSDNPLFVDGYDGRDPFLFHDEINERWIMYYTATSKPDGGHHIVAARISKDLINWSNDRYVVFKDTDKGTWGGNTESPVIIRRGDWFYLFIGPGASYVSTKVFKSRDPFNWDLDDEITELKTHAAEIFQDESGKWHISHCGIKRGGLYIAPFYWNDELQEKLENN